MEKMHEKPSTRIAGQDTAQRKTSGGHAAADIQSSPRMLAQRKQLEAAFGAPVQQKSGDDSVQLAAKKDKKFKK